MRLALKCLTRKKVYVRSRQRKLEQATIEMSLSFVDFIGFLTTTAKVTDIATGQIMGAGISKASTSLVQDIISPVMSVATNGSTLNSHFMVLRRGGKYPYATIEEAEADGAVVMKYGNTAYAVFNLLVQALVVYMILGAWKRCFGGVCARK